MPAVRALAPLAALVTALFSCTEAATPRDPFATMTGGTSPGGADGAGAMTGSIAGAGAFAGSGMSGGAGAGGVLGLAGTATGGVPAEGGAAGAGLAGGGAASAGTGGAGAAGSAGGVGGTGAGAGGGGAGASAGGTPTGGAGGDAFGGLGGLGGTPSRPILTSEQASRFTTLAYLARTGAVTAPTTDNWDPTAGVGDVASFTPTYTVATSGGTHATVQAAVTAAVTAGGRNRVFIRVMPGTYREVVCVPTNAPPITLYGTSADPSQTKIVYDHLSGTTVDSVVNPCSMPSGSTYGTSGSATFAAFGAGFMMKNLTVQNDGDEASVPSGVQGVALSTKNDKLVFENVHLLGNQDTLLAGTSNVSTIMRAYFKNATIEGDVDFICGRATAVFDGGVIRLATNRRDDGNLLAPSSDSRNPYGFLVVGATLTAGGGARAGGMTLGRAWDEGQADVATYTANVGTGVYPNGQSVIRDSTLGAHVNGTSPWAAAATTSRPFSSTGTASLPANRLYEFANQSP
jgi:pectinesterase